MPIYERPGWRKSTGRLPIFATPTCAATFHMGSTRDGLVGSTIPMHGSRTGFYTDEYIEQDFKAPEEIRKANLRGADLRGADITDVDFYLVDLRDALYDREQEWHLRRCGAILESAYSRRLSR